VKTVGSQVVRHSLA